MIKAPCKDCLARSPTCHVDCEAYQEYAKERELIRAQREIGWRVTDALFHGKNRKIADMIREKKRKGR